MFAFKEGSKLQLIHRNSQNKFKNFCFSSKFLRFQKLVGPFSNKHLNWAIKFLAFSQVA